MSSSASRSASARVRRGRGTEPRGGGRDSPAAGPRRTYRRRDGSTNGAAPPRGTIAGAATARVNAREVASRAPVRNAGGAPRRARRARSVAERSSAKRGCRTSAACRTAAAAIVMQSERLVVGGQLLGQERERAQQEQAHHDEREVFVHDSRMPRLITTSVTAQMDIGPSLSIHLAPRQPSVARGA